MTHTSALVRAARLNLGLCAQTLAGSRQRTLKILPWRMGTRTSPEKQPESMRGQGSFLQCNQKAPAEETDLQK